MKRMLMNLFPNTSFFNRYRWRLWRIYNKNIKKCIIFKNITIYPSTEIKRLSIGVGASVNSEVRFELGASGPASIGNNCAIGPRVSFETVNYSKNGIRKLNGKLTNQIKKIGNRVWIGNGMIVLPNVEIVEDCVVCAGAVVKKISLIILQVESLLRFSRRTSDKNRHDTSYFGI